MNKTKKHRKPMSPEQKKAAVERLALARAKKIHPNTKTFHKKFNPYPMTTH